MPHPFTSITVDGTNCVPFTVTTAEAVPVISLLGEMDVSVGRGLSTSKLMEVPELLTVPFTTLTVRAPPFAIWLAGTVAVSCVPLT